MKFSHIAAFVLTAAMGAEADNCTAGLKYCGSSLLKKGDYRGQIQQAFIAAGRDAFTKPDDWRFDCIGGSEGLIRLIGRCERGCKDNGTGKSDTCL
ncbi:hypothetical protein MN608_10002 [Microdochium nivale]|nr:hypothetical protein MN608_10002 [Microdochium nivale]